jgi:sporulation protein YlmC with PRC-barrel domain
MSQDGDKLGTIEEIYLDTETNQPEWALIATGLFGSKQSFVPISGAGREDDTVTVPFDTVVGGSRHSL